MKKLVILFVLFRIIINLIFIQNIALAHPQGFSLEQKYERSESLKVLSSDENQVEIEYNNPMNEYSSDYLILSFPSSEYEIKILGYKSYLEKSDGQKEYVEYLESPKGDSINPNNESNKDDKELKRDNTQPFDETAINSIIVLKNQGIFRRIHIYRLTITSRYNDRQNNNQFRTITYLKFKILFDDSKKWQNQEGVKESVIFKNILEKCVDNHIVVESFQDYQNKDLKDIQIFPDILGEEYAKKSFVKITVNKTSFYSLSNKDLEQLGVDTSKINLNTIQLFNRDKEVPILVEDGDSQNEERFKLTFLGKALSDEGSRFSRDIEFADKNVYWLTWGVKEGLRIVKNQETNNVVFNEAPTIEKKALKFAFEEKYSYDYGFLYWEEIGKNGKQIILDIPEIVNGENIYRVRLKFNKRDSSVFYKINSLDVFINAVTEPFIFSSNNVNNFVFESDIPGKAFNKGANFFSINYPPKNNDVEQKIYLEALEIEGDFELFAKDDFIQFKLKDNLDENIIVSGFSYSPIICYDVNNNELLNFSDSNPQPERKKWYEEIKYEIYALSRSGSNLKNVQLLINNKKVLFKYTKTPLRGYCLYVIDKINGEVKDFEFFDTWGDVYASQKLSNFVDKISSEYVVIGLVLDEGSKTLTETAVNALRTLGVKEDIRGKANSVHIFIGQKGLQVGEALESFSEEGHCILTFPFSGDKGIVLDKNRKDCFISSRKAFQNPLSMELVDFSSCIPNKTQTDYLVVTHSKFQKGAERLIKLREKQNLSTKIVYIDTIYNLFNYGVKSPYPLRDFLRYAYEEWEKPSPTFVCLLGDASWDMKDMLHTGVFTYVPSFSKSPIKQENANDDWFVSVENTESDYPDMIVGRVSVETEEDADNYLDKIEDYEADENWGIWKERSLVVCDNTFEVNGEELSSFVPENFVRRQISISDYAVEDNSRLFAANIKRKRSNETKKDVVKKLSEGNLIVQYVGHGGGTVWAHEDIFFATAEKGRSSVEELTNKGKYSFFSNWSCLTGIFNFNLPPFNLTLSEALLLKKNGGAIGLYSPSGKDSTSEHLKVSYFIHNAFFKEGLRRTGEAVYYGEIKYRMKEPMRSLPDEFNLIGDPAVLLNIPTYQEKLRVTPSSFDYRKTLRMKVEAELKSYAKDSQVTLYFLNDKMELVFKINNLDISSGKLVKEIEIPAYLYEGSMQVNLYYYDKETKVDGIGSAFVNFALPVFEFSDNCQVIGSQDQPSVSSNDISDKIMINIFNDKGFDLRGIPLVYKLNSSDWRKIDTDKLGCDEISNIEIEDKLKEGLNKLTVKTEDSYSNSIERSYEIVRVNNSNERFVEINKDIEVVRVFKENDKWMENIRLKVHNVCNKDISNLKMIVSQNSRLIKSVELPVINSKDFVFVDVILPFEEGEKNVPLSVDIASMVGVTLVITQNDKAGTSPAPTIPSTGSLEKQILSTVLEVPFEPLDLRIVPDSLKIENTDNLIDGRTIFFEFEIENLSKISANNISISCFYKKGNGPENMIYSEYLVNRYNMISLKPQERKKIKYRWDPFDNRGSNTIIVKVNVDRGMYELDESNNKQEINVYVKSKADLVITKDDLRVTEGEINMERGERSFSLMIQNKGEMPAENIFLLVTQLDEKLEEKIERINPNERKEVCFKFNVDPGLNFDIHINKDANIDESDFSNNLLSVKLGDLKK